MKKLSEMQKIIASEKIIADEKIQGKIIANEKTHRGIFSAPLTMGLAKATIALIILSVVLSSAMILAVYVTIGTRVEANVVKRQTAFVVDSLLSDTSLLGGSGTAALKAYLSTVQPPDMSAEDAQVAASNRAVLLKAVKYIAAACGAGLMVSYVLCGTPAMFASVLLEAVVSAGLAGATEAIFLLCIGQWYVSADPNQVKLMILSQLQAESKGQ